MRGVRRALAALALGATAVAAAEAPPAAPAPAASAPAAPAPAPSYLGAEVCESCHEAAAATYAKTPHAPALAGAERPESQRGCEACHGPGSDHMEAGGAKASIRTFARERPARERSAPCLGCHAGAADLHGWAAGEHALSAVACTDCHRMHGGVGARLLHRPTPALCEGCHLEVRAEFRMTERHGMGDRPLDCLECHRPHGARSATALRRTPARECLRCHGEYEGPFVFEHEGLVTEGCVRCHKPHGTPNRHLLLYQQVAQLCYDCHTVTPSSHLQPSFRDCTRCHTAIHGSNTDPRFLER
jgi:DmsE family decaheme c-type cytochrome